MGIPICKASGVLRTITTIRESKAVPRVLAGAGAAVHPAVVREAVRVVVVAERQQLLGPAAEAVLSKRLIA
jgi:hypothetical protein